MKRIRAVFPLTIAALLLATAVPLALAAPRTSEKYAFTTYRERTNALTVLVDSYPASLHASDDFIPIPIAVGLRSAGITVRFTVESFELRDSQGNVYPVASYKELMRGYPKRSFDETIFRAHPLVVGSQFNTSRPVRAAFFPAPGRGIRIPKVELAPYTWFRDVLYFPMPNAGLRGTLTLRVKGPAGQWVGVRFQVPEQSPRFAR